LKNKAFVNALMISSETN